HLRGGDRALSGRRRGRAVHVGEHADLDQIVGHLGQRRRGGQQCRRQRPEHAKIFGKFLDDHSVSLRELAHWPLLLVPGLWDPAILVSFATNLGSASTRLRSNCGPPGSCKAVSFRADSVHSGPMITAQRLPASLTPLDAALAAVLRDVAPVTPLELAPAE